MPAPSQERSLRAPPMVCSGSYALYIGPIQPRKNLARLIDAYTKLSQPESPEWIWRWRAVSAG